MMTLKIGYVHLPGICKFEFGNGHTVLAPFLNISLYLGLEGSVLDLGLGLSSN